MTDKTPAELLAMQARTMTMMLIETHLRSIRNMLTFFTIILVLSLIFQVVGAFFSFLG
jgi:hypothetical protein